MPEINRDICICCEKCIDYCFSGVIQIEEGAAIIKNSY